MSKGIVYILTNPCLDGWVKIGMTERTDIQKRLDELNQPPNIPLSFRAYALYHVENPIEVEQSIHRLIDLIDDTLHASETLGNGKIRQREFFKTSPEKAFAVFAEIAKLRGDTDELELVQATPNEAAEERVANTGRREKFSFEMLDIPIGAELVFIYDEAGTCKVADRVNRIEYKGEYTTLSPLATALLLDRKLINGTYIVQGTMYFKYEGETLTERRKRLESQADGFVSPLT